MQISPSVQLTAAASPGHKLVCSVCNICVPALTEILFAARIYLVEYNTETSMPSISACCHMYPSVFPSPKHQNHMGQKSPILLTLSVFWEFRGFPLDSHPHPFLSAYFIKSFAPWSEVDQFPWAPMCLLVVHPDADVSLYYSVHLERHHVCCPHRDKDNLVFCAKIQSNSKILKKKPMLFLYYFDICVCPHICACMPVHMCVCIHAYALAIACVYRSEINFQVLP